MAQWIGDKIVLEAGPLTGHEQESPAVGRHETEADSGYHRPAYKESYITEYDDIQVYRQQGCYQHTKQLHTWSFYEHRMNMDGECWNIITNDDMQNPPDWSHPGSSSSKLSHDFCHIDTEALDDVYTNFWTVEMGGRQIWPFYSTESFQEDLWIWVNPRRFAAITNYQHSEKLKHVYFYKMHEHNILANRAPCWYFTDLTDSSGKVKDKVIALIKEPRCSSAAYETFQTGFEHKIAMKPALRREEHLHGKRKYSDPSGQTSTQQFDPSGNYSARDITKFNTSFANQSASKSATTAPTYTTSKVTMQRHGEVPPTATWTRYRGPCPGRKAVGVCTRSFGRCDGGSHTNGRSGGQLRTSKNQLRRKSRSKLL